MDEITLSIDGTHYAVEYSLETDENADEQVTVILPSGESRTTVLRGLSIKTAARIHLRSYIQAQKKARENASP